MTTSWGRPLVLMIPWNIAKKRSPSFELLEAGMPNRMYFYVFGGFNFP